MTEAALAQIDIDPRSALVYPEGWQSWTPTTAYPVATEQHGPSDALHQALGYRGPMTPGAFTGDGLLAVVPAAGEPVHVFAAAGEGVPRITARQAGQRLVVAADGPVVHLTYPGRLGHALRTWAGNRAVPQRPAPTVWCSWYRYFTAVTEADVLENLAVMGEQDLPIDVVQIDDGYQTGIGDWLSFSPRFDSLAGIVSRIREQGRRAGIWVAPFLVGARSQLAAAHPDWLVDGAWAGWNWDQDLAVLDTTHPDARQHLQEVFLALRGMGFDYFKLDFLFAGAIPGRRSSGMPAVAAYRDGLAAIREAVGPGAYLAGCGAPILPSIGLVDSMRVSSDTATYDSDPSGDLSSPGLAGAMLSGAARHWQDGLWWANDPDCLMVRPGFGRRGEWLQHCRAHAGLRSISDRLAELDDWGAAAARDYLAGSDEPLDPDPLDPDPLDPDRVPDAG